YMLLLLKLEGELDHHSAEKMRKRLDSEILKSGADTVVFDLSALSFMDSSGIGVLLGRYKLFATRKLFIKGASESIDRILKMSGVYTLIPPYEKEVS
ncbi:MAG: anti-sigma factor antagonist, partial [Clostridia bacterium]|nr:anti-sigma factor antagonist [Clostridia bacterium]